MTVPEATASPARMAAIERLLLLGQPFLLALGLILARWTAEATTIETLLRPAMVVLALTAVALIGMRLVIRSSAWAALLCDGLVLFTFRELWPAMLIAVVAMSWLVFIGLRRISNRTRPDVRTPRATARATGIFSSVFLVVMSVAAARGALVEPPWMHLPEYDIAGNGGPNVYVLLLDGYPRADTLEDTFGFDNGVFVEALEEHGFSISDEARTNYNKTWLTLASALNGAYIDELLGDQRPPADATDELRWLHALINAGSVIDAFRDRGYAIRTVPSPYTSTAVTTADEYLATGHLTEFEVHLVAASPWTFFFRDQVASYLFAGQAQQVIDTLQTTSDLAESRSAKPQLVLSHVHSPHTPFVLNPVHREEPPIPACFPWGCTFWEARLDKLALSFDEYRTGLSNQIEALNTLVLSTVRDIVAVDPDAVIILMSDHGTRYSLDDLPEQYRSFLAARTPGADGLFPPDESPVNIFRRLMAAYFGADIQPLPYRAWELDWAFNLRLTPMPED